MMELGFKKSRRRRVAEASVANTTCALNAHPRPRHQFFPASFWH